MCPTTRQCALIVWTSDREGTRGEQKTDAYTGVKNRCVAKLFDTGRVGQDSTTRLVIVNRELWSRLARSCDEMIFGHVVERVNNVDLQLRQRFLYGVYYR